MPTTLESNQQGNNFRQSNRVLLPTNRATRPPCRAFPTTLPLLSEEATPWKKFKDCFVKAKARIWPWLPCTCHTLPRNGADCPAWWPFRCKCRSGEGWCEKRIKQTFLVMKVTTRILWYYWWTASPKRFDLIPFSYKCICSTFATAIRGVEERWKI